MKYVEDQIFVSPIVGLITSVFISCLIDYSNGMVFRWLKSKMPRGLFGRAALILIFPIATLQLALTIDFTQRYFTDVTEQLSEGMALSVRAYFDTYQSGQSQNASALAETLQISVKQVTENAVPASNGRSIIDFSGLQIASVFQEHFPEYVGIWLGERRRVTVFLQSKDHVLQIGFARNRVAPINTHQFIVATFAIAVLMACIAGLFLRNQLKPIANLAAAAEAFGRGATTPYTIRGATEVRAAGRAFLDMRARIERHIEQRTLMLTSISHDLRTPLTRLRLECALLPRGQAEPMTRDIEEMSQMIDSFLDFARGDAKESPSERIEIISFMKEVVGNATKRGQKVLFTDPGISVYLNARKTDLRRAVENLLNNSNRHANRAELTVVAQEYEVQIIVDDDGPGIPDTDLERAKNPFERLDNSRNREDSAGAGLGLAIVADIAGAHGGSLSLTRSPKLGGLRATLTLGVT